MSTPRAVHRGTISLTLGNESLAAVLGDHGLPSATLTEGLELPSGTADRDLTLEGLDQGVNLRGGFLGGRVDGH